MKKIDLEEKSKEIQKLISRYTKESFVCFFADFIRNNHERANIGFQTKLKSKLKDSFYLIILRLSSPIEGNEELRYSEESNSILEKVADILLDIVNFYLADNYSENFEEIYDEDKRLLIHELAFRDFFQNGVLNYWEQELNKAIRMFEPYKTKIKERLDIEFKTLVDLCVYSEYIYKQKAISAKSFMFDKRFWDFVERTNSRETPEEKVEEISSLPENLQDVFLDFYERPHGSLILTKKDFSQKFNSIDIDTFFDLFSISIKDSFKNLFYTQENPLESKPIIKINENEFLSVYQKQLPTALYKLIYRTLSSNQKEADQLNRRKGKQVLELQVEEIFKKFFKKEKHFKIYTNYYINENPEEKDILILANRNAYIIECKASRNREPRRNLKEAYQRIKSDFNDCIQKGYEQCYQVEQILLNEDNIVIKSNGKKNKIEASEINEVFSIIVTSERFASIQSDLGLLLKRKNEEDLFPWSIYIDDLETFLISLKVKFNNHTRRFADFLDYRELLNNRLITRDELDVCAIFLKDPVNFKNLCESGDVMFTAPDLQNYFDRLYFEKKINFKILNI